MPAVHIRRSTLASADAARLIAALNTELTAAFPEPGAAHFSLSDAQIVAGDGAFVVAYLDGVAVGCGAVRRLDEATAEVKRMYVEPVPLFTFLLDGPARPRAGARDRGRWNLAGGRDPWKTPYPEPFLHTTARSSSRPG
jgi:hypothetical protein